MNKNISENLMCDLEILAISSAATAVSQKRDMQMYDRAGFAVCVNSTGFTTVTVDLMEATASTAAGSSNCAGRAGVTIGAQNGTGITTAGGVKAMTLALAGNTTNSTMVIGIGGVNKTLTYTTATASLNATAQTSTKLFFGSTVGSTVNTGAALTMGDLATKLSNTSYGYGTSIDVSTNTTADCKIVLRDSAAGAITFTGGASADGIGVTVQEAVAAFDVRADQLSTSGERWVGVKVSTAATACDVAVVTLRQPGRYMPSGDFKGELST